MRHFTLFDKVKSSKRQTNIERTYNDEKELKRIITILAIAFSAFMVIGRLISGVHWFTDIVGGVLLSAGLFTVYKAVVMLTIKK